jgi:hypothetical protein
VSSTTITLTALLALAPGTAGSPVEYVVGGQTLDADGREHAAQMLADDAMLLRCGDTPILARWRAVRDGVDPAGMSSTAAVVATYAKIGFGLPGDEANDQHLQGLVAELFWNRLIAERRQCSGGRELVKAHSVKPDPLEPGGDGLVVYVVDGTYVFRLWEIKKHESATRAISATIGRASKQLVTRGAEYLAKLAGPETIAQAGVLGDFYAEVVELWLDGSERAGVGVSVGTSAGYAPSRASAFESITAAFPKFSRAGQTESLVVAVPDFPAFAVRVREIVWSGL